MKKLIIVLLWVAIGYWYYYNSGACCPTTISSDSTKVTQVTEKTTKFSTVDPVTTTTYRFDESSVNLYGVEENKFLSGENEGVEIIGYAYSNEDEPYQLALLRAKEVQRSFGLSASESRIRGVVMEDNYTSSGDFISYNSFPISKSNNETAAETMELKQELRSAAYKLRNNFCKIELVSYNNDRSAGSKLCYQFKEELIKSGLSPGRISFYSLKQEDRNTSIIELRIIE